MFASAFYVTVDVSTYQVRYANAGHPRPLLLRRRANEVVALGGPGKRPGPALGVFADSKYEEEDRAMDPNDLLMLFTDGLYEVENSRGEFYDQQKLMNAVSARITLPAESLFESLLEGVRDFSATREFIDDVCMVGVEFGSPGKAAKARS
jgi:sigma-B regulation protein RsbU (phosphoserine phosphatase)